MQIMYLTCKYVAVHLFVAIVIVYNIHICIVRRMCVYSTHRLPFA